MIRDVLRRTILGMGVIVAALASAPLQAQESSFAQKDKSDHLLAFMTREDDLPAKQGQVAFSLPNTGLVYSLRHEAQGQTWMRFEGQGEIAREIPLSLDSRAGDKIRAWPMFVRLNAQTQERGYVFLLGVVIDRSKGYSGGGASESRLHLFRIDNPGSDHGRARQLAILPLAGDKLIRACFNGRDEAVRQGVCHDSYKFEAFIRLDESHRGHWPVLIYQSRATARADALTSSGTLPERPLTTNELTEKEDRACTFQRKLRFNELSQRYDMESLNADCSNYFLPDPNPIVSLCRTKDVAILVGQNRISDRAAMAFTGASIVRQITPGDAVTPDLQRERVTIENDPKTGKILSATCG